MVAMILILVLAIGTYFFNDIFSLMERSKYTLFDTDMPLEDRVTGFYLSLPGVFPFAQTWITNDDVGRAQIAKDRKAFNSFSNDGHSSKLAAKGLHVRTVSAQMRDGSLLDLHIYQSPRREEAQDDLSSSPLYIWMHGGGFVYGEGKDSMLIDGIPECNVTTVLQNEKVTFNNAIVVSIEYRLPPENKFPIPTNDCFDALLWLMDHSSEVGFDPSRVSIGGTSAGANLAAVLAQRAYRAGIQINYQLLLVPVMHYGCVTKSCMENANIPLLGAKEVIWFHNMYANSYEDGTDPHYNPLKYMEDCPPFFPRRGECGFENAVTLAPAMVVTAKKDTLRDDGLDLVEYLGGHCAVDVEHVELPGSHWSVYSHTNVYREKLNAGVCGG